MRLEIAVGIFSFLIASSAIRAESPPWGAHREDLAQEFRIPVRHDHTVRSCQGELVITGEEVAYHTTHRRHARRWRFSDIQLMTVASRTELSVLTYESDRWTLGRDRTFRFRVTKGELSPEVSAFLLSRIGRPVAMALAAPWREPLYEFGARHRHRFGGCQGTIRIHPEGVAYVSLDHPRDSRFWRWLDIQGIGRLGPYHFEIVTYEPEFGGPARPYVFDLKVSMSDEVYDFLWERVYGTASRATEGSR